MAFAFSNGLTGDETATVTVFLSSSPPSPSFSFSPADDECLGQATLHLFSLAPSAAELCVLPIEQKGQSQSGGHLVYDPDGRPVRGEWSLLSPLWGRNTMTYGLQEAYGFLWELARGVTRAVDDHAVDVAGRVYTQRSRADGTTASVPFLFNYEQDEDGARTLRLLQFLPIPLGGGDE